MNDIFSIILPAYNEEQSISGVVDRALAACVAISEGTGLQTEVIVVNDGSTDRTDRLLSGRPDIRRVDHPTNLGYGVALRSGISEARGDLVGFHDADGTCSTEAFIPMIRALREQQSDLVLGVRTAAGSRMPAVRRLGNRIFATLISLLCGTRVTDSATGMRVFPRGLIRRLYPLPDGLHFTPVMTAKALLEGLSITEVPIPYAEREGRSKLSVFKDGFRFLFSILGAVKLYEPVQLFGPLGLALLLAAVLGAAGPVAHYLARGHLSDPQALRMMLATPLGIVGALVLSVGSVAQLLADAVRGGEARQGLFTRCFPRYFIYRHSFAAGCLCVLLGLGALVPCFGIGGVSTPFPWAYVLSGGFLLVLGGNLILLKYLLSIVLELLSVLRGGSA